MKMTLEILEGKIKAHPLKINMRDTISIIEDLRNLILFLMKKKI
jgi:hypothetical protein